MRNIWRKYTAMFLTAVMLATPAVTVQAGAADSPEGTIVEDTAPAEDVGGSSDNANDAPVSSDITGDDAPVSSDITGGDAPVSSDITQDTDVEADIQMNTEDDDHVVIQENDKPYLALGANLSEEQKNTVLNLMGVDAAALDQYHVVTVTNEEEHQYLDAYLDKSTIGTKALSSVVIVKREKGNGINISTKNISYCTVGMYKNALATAGLEDADVIVAGPFPLSGTAALIGAMKAYADMEDTDVDTASLDAAMNEIVVTGDLSDSLGDNGQSEEFIAYLKKEVLEGGLKSKEQIQKVISDASKEFDITLTEEEKEKIISLMQKIGDLDIDVDRLLQQAGSIYDSLTQFEGSEGVMGSIGAFFRGIIDSIVNFFKNLFS